MTACCHARAVNDEDDQRDAIRGLYLKKKHILPVLKIAHRNKLQIEYRNLAISTICNECQHFFPAKRFTVYALFHSFLYLISLIF